MYVYFLFFYIFYFYTNVCLCVFLIFICFILLPASKSPEKLAPETIDAIKQRYGKLQQQLQQQQLQIQQGQGQGQHKLIDIDIDMDKLKPKSLFGQQQVLGGDGHQLLGDENRNQQQHGDGQQQQQVQVQGVQVSLKQRKLEKEIGNLSPEMMEHLVYKKNKGKKTADYITATEEALNKNFASYSQQDIDDYKEFAAKARNYFDNQVELDITIGTHYKLWYDTHYNNKDKKVNHNVEYFLDDVKSQSGFSKSKLRKCIRKVTLGADKVAVAMYVSIFVIFILFPLLTRTGTG